MDANEYQALALRTAPNIAAIERLTNAALGLSGEAGEFADAVKKARYQGHDLDVANLANELGDIAWYVALACESLGLSLGDVMHGNIEKLQRRYPDGFSTAASVARVDVV
jgi:NTP pyrophosphatase (non-canonical NTP hydrolase)